MGRAAKVSITNLGTEAEKEVKRILGDGAIILVRNDPRGDVSYNPEESDLKLLEISDVTIEVMVIEVKDESGNQTRPLKYNVYVQRLGPAEWLVVSPAEVVKRCIRDSRKGQHAIDCFECVSMGLIKEWRKNVCHSDELKQKVILAYLDGRSDENIKYYELMKRVKSRAMLRAAENMEEGHKLLFGDEE